MKALKLLTGAALALTLSSAFAATLNVPLTTQEHSNWCWAASSKAVLNLYNKTPSQCQIVNWSLGINYACGNSNFYWSSYANRTNSMGSVKNILTNWGVPNTGVYSSLSWNSVVAEIDNRRPIMVVFQWTNGGGHLLVGRGYETYNNTNYVYIMDPWPGEGQTFRTYSSAVSTSAHKWIYTEKMDISS